jgi:hypothetical protein
LIFPVLLATIVKTVAREDIYLLPLISVTNVPVAVQLVLLLQFVRPVLLDFFYLTHFVLNVVRALLLILQLLPHNAQLAIVLVKPAPARAAKSVANVSLASF